MIPETQTDERPAYEGLAAIYDHVMRHVDYAEWARYIDSIFKRHGAEPATLVDLACGTGNVTMQLNHLGYSISGVDRSGAMVQVAQSKSESLGNPVNFCRGDLRQLDGVGPFDAAVCLYDSFNYLTTCTDVALALAEVHKVLEPRGMFIFDVCTERNSVLHFQDVQESEQGPDFVYSRRSYYDREQKMQFNSFEIRFDGQESMVTETHAQRIYAHEELVELIGKSQFDLVGAYDGFTFADGSDESDRVHFILRKAE
jgi:ubiquinone/menaquinone biosynthesis C-methylase UbiE